MTSTTLRRTFAGALLSFALAGAACGASAAAPGPVDDPTPEWSVQKEYEPTAAPTVTQVAPPETPVVQPEFTATPSAVAAPAVLWMRTSHAGPGAVTIRFATSVPTTATVSVLTNQVGPTAFFTEDLTELATEHETSVPAGAPGRYQVRVVNAEGEIARAELRYKSDPQGLDWATGGAAPKVIAVSAKQLDVSYGFPANHPSKLGFPGTVHIFMTDGDCTTADACMGELVGSELDTPAGGNGQLETHKAIASIPGAAFDYQVILGQPLNIESSMKIFLQLEIRGDELPKTKMLGPGEIKAN
jgi:hypothetical protein